jgi:hypothetical protein
MKATATAYATVIPAAITSQFISFQVNFILPHQ